MRSYNVFDISGKFLFKGTRNEICANLGAKYQAIRSSIQRKGIYDGKYYITDNNYFDYTKFDYSYTEERCNRYTRPEMIGIIKINQ